MKTSPPPFVREVTPTEGGSAKPHRAYGKRRSTSMMDDEVHRLNVLKGYSDMSASLKGSKALIQRRQSVPSLTMSGRKATLCDDDLDQQDRDSLRALHSEFLQRPQPPTFAEGTSTKRMLQPWGQYGSWYASCELPWYSEEPMKIRSPSFWPQEGAQLLKQWGVSAVNTKGKKPKGGDAIGQDNFCVAVLPDGWEVFCVADGHGHIGHWVATHAVRTLPYILRCARCSALLRRDCVEEALDQAFQMTQQDLAHRAHAESQDLNLSGTTLTVVLRHAEREVLWVGCSGDTKAILLDPGSGVAVHATTDHHPDIQEERERIESSGGEVRIRNLADGHVEMRVYEQNRQWPGLCMTRSLGDALGKAIGVTEQPEVQAWPLQNANADALVLIATDGIWEFLETHRVAEIVLGALAEGKTKDEALHSLLEVARQKWQEDQADYCDDITAILAPACGPAAPRLPQDRRAKSSCMASCSDGARRACTIL